MDTLTDAQRAAGPAIDLVFQCLASSERRRLLTGLTEAAPYQLTVRDLVPYLNDVEEDTAEDLETEDVDHRALQRLHHIHVPKLAAAELIHTEADQGSVALADHPAFDDSGIRAVISDGSTGDPDSLDGLFAALADPRRRSILDVLSHQLGPIHTETLARELGAFEQNVAESDVPAEAVDDMLHDLHHIQLPHLRDAGVIEYNSEDRTVAYTGHPALRVPWMHSVLEPQFRQSLTGESTPEGIGEIEGRDGVISFGQSLCDRADEELFCMFTDTDLLEAGCLTRISQAAERGVDVYLGTRDPDIRDFVHEHAPAVVLWEPDTNWLNLPAAGDRVGRLLLADREAVMLGTLLEETTDGVHHEQAIIAEGAHNTLVTMICQLVSPHLEQLTAQHENVDADLPL